MTILKTKLNDYFALIVPSPEKYVDFLKLTETDTLTFKAVNCVAPILVNIEEEKIIRQANRYEGVSRNNIKTEMNPSIGINLLVLFISRFSEYDDSLKFISLVISYFQQFPVIDHYNTPSLSDSIDKVTIELISLPVAQKNEIWSSLKLICMPAVAYKVGVLVYRDDSSVGISSEVGNVDIKTTLL